jgi:polysaccharide export outer membrane protein
MFRLRFRWVFILAVCVPGAGCVHEQTVPDETVASPLPRELNKVCLPSYVIEPPDILQIDALRVTPRPPYRIHPEDALVVQSSKFLPDEPISGVYVVTPEGTVNLGLKYGTVSVVDMSLEEARRAVEKQVRKTVAEAKVDVSLARSHGMQQIRGQHLVRPDGTVNLGLYGDVNVTGLTLAEAKARIEAQLAQFVTNPEITLDVVGYNSKVYYVVIDLAGAGQQVVRLPLTGNETVLDAISQLNGLPPPASKTHIWVARPCPSDSTCDQVLPVDWHAVTEAGSTKTNYQLLPGDRVYVKADPLIATDNFLAKLYAPIERTFGIILLGSTTVNSIRNGNNGTGTGTGR